MLSVIDRESIPFKSLLLLKVITTFTIEIKFKYKQTPKKTPKKSQLTTFIFVEVSPVVRELLMKVDLASPYIYSLLSSPT